MFSVGHSIFGPGRPVLEPFSQGGWVSKLRAGRVVKTTFLNFHEPPATHHPPGRAFGPGGWCKAGVMKTRETHHLAGPKLATPSARAVVVCVRLVLTLSMLFNSEVSFAAVAC